MATQKSTLEILLKTIYRPDGATAAQKSMRNVGKMLSSLSKSSAGFTKSLAEQQAKFETFHRGMQRFASDLESGKLTAAQAREEFARLNQISAELGFPKLDSAVFERQIKDAQRMARAAQFTKDNIDALATGFDKTQIQMKQAAAQTVDAERKMKSLAHEVARGDKTIDEAADEYAEFAKTLKKIKLPDGLSRQTQKLAADVRSGAKDFDTAERELREYTEAARKAGDSAEKLGRQVQESGDAAGQTGGWGNLKSQIKGAVAAYVTLEAAQQAAQLVDEGATIDATAKKFGKLAEGAGVAADALLGEMRHATRGTVSDFALMRSGADLLNLGIADSADEVTRFARLIGGLDWDPDILNLTIANQSTQRLDSLGIGIDDLKSRAKALADQGYSTEQAFKFALLAAGEAKLDEIGSSADDASVKVAQLKTITENWTNAARLAVLDGAEPLIDALLRLHNASEFESELGVGDLGASNKELRRAAEDAGVAVDEIEALADALANAGFTKNQAIEIAIETAIEGEDISDLNTDLTKTAEILSQVEIPGSLQGQVGQLGESLRAFTGDSETTKEVMTAMFDEFGRSEQEVQALQTAVFLLANGYEGTTDALIEQTVALASSSDPLKQAAELLNQNTYATSNLREELVSLTAGFSAELDPAIADHQKAVVDGTAKTRSFTEAESDLLAGLLQNLDGFSATERAVIGDAVAKQENTDTIFGMVSALGELTPSQMENVKAVIAAQLAIQNLDSSDADYMQKLIELTGIVDTNTAALFANANARALVATNNGSAISQSTIGFDTIDAARAAGQQEREHNAMLRRIEAQNQRVREMTARPTPSSGGIGRAAIDEEEAARIASEEEIAAARDRLREDTLSAEIRIAKLRRDANADIATERANEVTEIAKLEADAADEVAKIEKDALADRKKAEEELAAARLRAVDEYNQRQANGLLSFADQIESGKPPSLADFVEEFLAAKAASGDTAQNVADIAVAANAIDPDLGFTQEVAEAAARAQEIRDAFESLARAELDVAVERDALDSLIQAIGSGGDIDAALGEYGVAVEDANAYAIRVTEEQAAAIVDIETQKNEDIADANAQLQIDIQDAQAATQTRIAEINAQVRENTAAEYAKIVETAMLAGVSQAESWSIVQSALGTTRGQLGNFASEIAALPSHVPITIRVQYEVESPPPGIGAGAISVPAPSSAPAAPSSASPQLQNRGGRQLPNQPYIVGDAPGGRITPYSELIVPDASGLVVGNDQIQTALNVFENFPAIAEKMRGDVPANVRAFANGGRYRAGETMLVGDAPVGSFSSVLEQMGRSHPGFGAAEAMVQLIEMQRPADSGGVNISVDIGGVSVSGGNGNLRPQDFGRLVAAEVKRQVEAALRERSTLRQARRVGAA